jgi:esterase/lipase superfamily enzyme
LQFPGLPILYSWPSEGAATRYTVDEANVGFTRPNLFAFLRLVRAKLGLSAVHVVAHSMGSRALAETLGAAVDPTSSPECAALRQVVFAAPDVDAETFQSLAEAFHGKAERVTLYASSKDKALRASKAVHKYRRAGDAGDDIVVVGIIDTVDASAVDTSFMGHSYYGDNRSVLTDLFTLIRRGAPPTERFGLMPRQTERGRYWLFAP